MERLLYKRYGIGAVFLILSVVFIVFGIKNAAAEKEYAPSYVNAAAVITEKMPFPEGLESFADVVYTDMSGAEHSVRIEYYGSADVGDTIEIQISANNPELAWAADGTDESGEQAEKTARQKRYAVIEIIAGVIMLALGIFLLIRRRNSEKASAETVSPRTETAKPAPVPPPQTAAAKYDIEEILKKIDEQIPPKPVVKLEPKRAEGLSVFESKLGGIPYMPADFEYPKGKSGIFEGRPLRLLAQLNFEKLPHIENFPKKGILQFFCSDDEEDGAYGLNFKNPVEQDGFRIIYHENIIADESRLMPKESMPEFTADMGNFPFEGEFLLEAGDPESCPISAGDHRFEKLLLKILCEASGKEYKNIYEIGGEEEELCEKLYEMRAFEQTCIGGYPFFTQDDPRGYNEELSDYNVLLFQCASSYEDNRDDEIMWGDMGVANFFISEKDLKNLDFSKAAYNWDCG